ncbi:head-tail connector protein [Enterococcus rotai]|uniref:head-tail connector protein n=1 Tax=Enterococcus rotai TaxID=118060 RepID=UPI0035C6AA33
MSISVEELEKVKLYCKIDINFEDELVREFIEAVEEQICDAIEKGSTAETFKDYKKFKLAVKKQVKEEYEHRGLSADNERYPLANGVLNIIHQLRYRGDPDENTKHE